MTSGRALYVDVGCDVSLDDGVALKVQQPGRSRSLYPLRRLSRVHSAAAACWSVAALLACLRAGVPVVFHDARGAVCGWCFGPRQRESTLAVLLAEAVRDPDWPDFWRAWLRQVSMREGRALGQLLHMHVPTGSSCDQMEISLCNRLRDRWRQAPGPWVRALRSAMRTLAAEVCAAVVGDPRVMAYAAPGLNLPDIVAQLAGARAVAMLLRRWPGAAPQLPPALCAALVMEQDHAELYRSCAAVLGDLEHCLREREQ